MADTTYQVGIEYNLGGNAAEAIGRVAKSAEGMTRSLKDGIKNMALMGAGALGLQWGFRSLAQAVFGANIALETTVDRVTGTLFAFQSWKKGVSPIQAVTASLAEAEKVARRLEDTETRLAISAEDLTLSYTTLAGPVLGRMGKSREELLRINDLVADSAKVFGMSTKQVADYFSQIVESGRISSERADPFTVSMRKVLGTSKEMRNLSREEIFRRMVREMEQLGPAAGRIAQSFEDQWFRVRDTIGDTIRDVTTPVFKYISGRLGEWKSTFSEESIKRWGQALLRTFQTFEKLTVTVLENWKAIAAIWAGAKIGNMAAGLGGFLANLQKSSVVDPIFNKAAGGLSKFAATLGTATIAVGALAIGLQGLISLMESSQAQQIDMGGKAQQLSVAAQQIQQGNLRQAYKIMAGEDVGAAKGGAVDLVRTRNLLERLPQKDLAAIGKALGAPQEPGFAFKGGYREGQFRPDVVAKHFAGALSGMSGIMLPKGPGFRMQAQEGELTKPPRVVNNFYGGIKIEQDFLDKDPDRIWVRIKRDLENESTRRVQAVGSDPFAI